LSVTVGYYGALTAYIIGEGQVLALIFNQPDKALWFSLGFFLIWSLLLGEGLNKLKKVEAMLVAFVILAIIVLALVCSGAVKAANLLSANWSAFFAPYGVLLFAFGGTGAIFSVKEILQTKRAWIKPAIVAGSLIPLVLYALFAAVVVGVTGSATTEIATIGLGAVLGYKIILLGSIFAALAMATSFLTVGTALKQMYRYDYRFPPLLAWLATVSVPLLIFLFVSRDFINIIGLAGSFTFGLTGILVILAFWRAKKAGDRAPEYSLPRFKLYGWFLIFMFLAGIVSAGFEIFGAH
jgi:tyrosine-specific transport protein